jgi:hypothetical protein
MSNASRIRNTRENWPFRPWSTNTAARWELNERAPTALFSGRTMRGWLIVILVPILLVGLAGVAVAHRHAGSQTTSQDRLGQSACADQHIAELVREHLLVVRGL